jgi:predicted NBD/HSP70 family sugar kinase
MVSLKRLSQAERCILSEIFWTGGSSRGDLATRLDFSKSKVNAAISSLLGASLVGEAGPRESSGGRRAEGLRMTLDGGLIGAVDIGASSLHVALLAPDMAILAQHSEAADVRVAPDLLFDRVRDLLDQLLERLGRGREAVAMIGVGVPGPVDFESACLVHPPLMPGWEGYSPRDALARDFSGAVFVDNDVNILALGVLWRLRRAARNFLVVKVGTGIGCGIVCDGAVYRGAAGSAGDVGHICVDPQGPVCHCGNVGCVEAMAAGPAIARLGEEAARAGESLRMRALLEEKGALTPEDVGMAGREGDAAANAIIREAGANIGRMLAAIVNFYNPSHMFLCGGVVGIGPSFLSSIRQSVYQRSLPLSTRHLEIQPVPDADTAGIIGAGVMAFLESL